MSLSRNRLLPSIASILKDELLNAGIGRNSCIAATRVAVDVLCGAGIEAEPLAVNVVACNPPFVSRMQREGHMADSGKELDRWFAEDGAYVHCLGIGPVPRGQWSGHLVTIVRREWMLDLTIDQVNRAEYRLLAPGFLLWPVSNGFLRGVEKLNWATMAGAEFLYEARPHDASYHATAAWNHRSRTAPVVRRAFSRVARLDGLEHRQPATHLANRSLVGGHSLGSERQFFRQPAALPGLPR